MKNNMTVEESIQIIQKSICNSRKNMRDGSFYYLLWGWSLILASLSNYGVLRYYIQEEAYAGLWWKSMLVWIIFLGIAALIQFMQISRSSKKEKVISHLDRYITILWLSAGVIMALMVFLAFKVNSYPVPFILGITAMATYTSGAMVKYKPLMIGGFVFLISSVISIYLSGLEQLIIFAVAMALGYLIPGYLLRTIKIEDDV